MVSFTVRMRFEAKDREEIADMLRLLATESRQEPGCVSYVPHFVDGAPGTVLIYEQYHDDDAVLAHQATRHFKQYATGGLYQRMLDRQVETLTAVA